jgi:hypothetical protein
VEGKGPSLRFSDKIGSPNFFVVVVKEEVGGRGLKGCVKHRPGERVIVSTQMERVIDFEIGYVRRNGR